MLEFWKKPLGVHPNDLPGERSRQGLAIAVKRLNLAAGQECVRFIPGMLPDKSDCKFEVRQHFGGYFFPSSLVCRMALEAIDAGQTFLLPLTVDEAKHCRSEIRTYGWGLYVSKADGGFVFTATKPAPSGGVYDALEAIDGGLQEVKLQIEDVARVPYFRAIVSQKIKGKPYKVKVSFDSAAKELTIRRIGGASESPVGGAFETILAELPKLNAAQLVELLAAVRSQTNQAVQEERPIFDFELDVAEII